MVHQVYSVATAVILIIYYSYIAVNMAIVYIYHPLILFS